MNKQFLWVLAVFMLLLGACGQQGKSTIEKKDSVEEESIKLVQEDSKESKEEQDRIVKEEPLYELDESWAFRPIGEADSKVVLLTIDDAPDKHALDMAYILKELDVPAIFFVNGHFITSDEDKETLKEIHDLGFAIGNHTKTHANLRDISEDEQGEEILSVSDAVETIIGERPKFFRSPHGINTDYSKALVEGDGMLLMNWSYGYDWEKAYMDSDTLTDIMVNTELLGNGANLLMHDRKWTADALRGIVKGLRAKGYDFIDPATIKGIDD